jgi:hypothetical protein
MASAINIVGILSLLACDACGGTALGDSPFVTVPGPVPVIHSEIGSLDGEHGGVGVHVPFKVTDESIAAALAHIHVYWVLRKSDLPIEFRESEFDQFLNRFAPNSSSDYELSVDPPTASDLLRARLVELMAGPIIIKEPIIIGETTYVGRSGDAPPSSVAVVMLKESGVASGEWFQERLPR